MQDWFQILGVFGGGSFVTMIVQRVIKHQYDKKITSFKNQVENRKRSQLVAELFAEWLSVPDKDRMTDNDRVKKLNKLSFEATLWLPVEIATELGQVLQHKPAAKSIEQILLDIRTILQGESGLKVSDVTTWSKPPPT